MSLERFLTDPLIARIGGVLFHSLWQAAAVALAAAVLLATMRRSSANARYAVGFIALLAIAVLGVSTFAFLAPSPSSPAQPTPANVAAASRGEGQPAVSPQEPQRRQRWIAWTGTASPGPFSSTGLADAVRLRARSVAGPLAPWFALAWLASLSVLSLWHAGGYLKVRSFSSSARDIDDARWLARLASLCERLRVSTTARLAESARAAGPLVIGALRPVILMPVGSILNMTPAQLEAALAHELAHVRRYDYLANIVQTVIETLLFYHPAAWWLSRRVRAEREHAADDLAVSVCGDRGAYARALYEIAESADTRHVFAVSATGGVFSQRIHRLLGTNRRRSGAAALLLGALVVAVLAASVAIYAAETGASTSEAPQDIATEDAQRVPVEEMSLEDIIAKRDRLLAEADGKIRSGLVELAEKFPQLKKAKSWDGQIHRPARDGQISLWLFHTHLGKAADSAQFVPEKDRYSLLAVVRPPHSQPIQMMMGPLYPDLGLVGQVNAWATDPELAAALKKLVSEALAPLGALNIKAEGRTPFREQLLRRPPQIDTGATPLHEAATDGEHDKAQRLIKGGADIHALDTKGRTPLHKAAREGHLLVAKLLVDSGAKVDARDFSDWSPLAMAAYNGHSAMAGFLIDAGAPTTDRNALDKAAMGGHLALVQLLLEKGFPLAGPNGAMPLQPAAISGHVEMLQFFLARGADVNIADSGGRTALHCAAQGDHAAAAALLIESGADINATDSRGRTPLDSAQRLGSAAVDKLLREHGAKSGALVVRRETPLHVAAGGGHLEATRTLVSAGVDVNARDPQGRTPLHRAAAGGHMGTVIFLVEAGADATARDDTGRTPAECAREAGHFGSAAAIEEALPEPEKDSGEPDQPTISRNVIDMASTGTLVRPDLEFPTAEAYSAAIGEPGLVIDGAHVMFFAPKRREKEARIIAPYLERAYDVLYNATGVHTRWKITVYHFPEGHPMAAGGTSNCVIRYGYNNLALETQDEWTSHRVPHVSGYIEEMSHNFRDVIKCEFGWEAMGWILGVHTSAAVARNPVHSRQIAETCATQESTRGRYRRNDYRLPGDIPANLSDRVHASILRQCEREYGEGFWPDFFQEARKRWGELLAAVDLGDADAIRNERYRITVECFDALEGLDFKAMLEENGISTTVEIKSLATKPDWNRYYR